MNWPHCQIMSLAPRAFGRRKGCAITALLIARGLGRVAPAGEPVPSAYSDGARRTKGVPGVPQVLFAVLFAEPSTLRNSAGRSKSVAEPPVFVPGL